MTHTTSGPPVAHAPKKCTPSGNFQFDIKSPSDFKILSARKLKTLFQKYKLELTTGIHACIGHASCVNTREFLKDTTTADSHENVAWKSEFTFFQSLSWLFQLSYFLKCKRWLFWSWISILTTSCKFMKTMNFVIACLRPSKNVKLVIFSSSRAVDGKEKYKKAWCTCKVVVLPCEAIANLTFSSPLHLEVPIVYDTLWSVKNRIFLGQIKLLLLRASPRSFFSC